MEKIKLNCTTDMDVTTVSNFFIDRYMPQANGDFVKIYIHLLRMMNSRRTDISLGKMADAFNFTEGDILRALKYWEGLGLLSIARGKNNVINGIRLNPFGDEQQDSQSDDGRESASGVYDKENASGGDECKNSSDDVRESVSVGGRNSFSDGERKSASGGGRNSFSDGERKSVSGGGQNSFSDGERKSASVGGRNSFSDGERKSVSSGCGQENVSCGDGRENSVDSDRKTGVTVRFKHQYARAGKKIPPKKNYTAGEIEAVSGDPNVAQLLFVAQTYLARPLGSAETGSLLYLYDRLKLPSDFIEYIMEKCISDGHKSMSYMEKTAVDFYRRGITDVPSAKASLRRQDDFAKKILDAFGISGRLAAKEEQNFIIRWRDEYGFSEEIVIEACNRTISHTHTPSFVYADSILLKWRDAGVKNTDDIARLDRQHDDEVAKKYAAKKKQGAYTAGRKKKQASIKSHAYDFDNLEKQLLASKN